MCVGKIFSQVGRGTILWNFSRGFPKLFFREKSLSLKKFSETSIFKIQGDTVPLYPSSVAHNLAPTTAIEV